MIGFLITSSLYSDFQFGFRSSCSTAAADDEDEDFLYLSFFTDTDDLEDNREKKGIIFISH